MSDAGVILAVMAGILIGIVGGLLMLIGKNRRMAELKVSIRNFEENAAALREKLDTEVERRAAAEEKSSRLPGLEQGLEKAAQENTALQAKLSELETRLEDERKNTDEKLALLQEASGAAEYPMTIRMQPGYDHSYFFIASFIGEHLAFHAGCLY